MANTALATVAPTALDRDEFTEKRVDLIRKTFANDAPPLEFEMFVAVCRRTGLSPEAKQIYFIQRKGRWTIQTSIDGYRLIADRSRAYAGSDDPVYEGSGTLTNGKTHPLKATTTVWKIVQGQRCPFTATARWDEYNAGVNLWQSMPHTMLAKCSESLALRKAFPAELSGLYTGDEMEQADAPTTTSAHVNSVPRSEQRDPNQDDATTTRFLELIEGATTEPEMQRIGAEIKSWGGAGKPLRDAYKVRYETMTAQADAALPDKPDPEGAVTARQIELIESLLQDCGIGEQDGHGMSGRRFGGRRYDGLTRQEASSFIDELRESRGEQQERHEGSEGPAPPPSLTPKESPAEKEERFRS